MKPPNQPGASPEPVQSRASNAMLRRVVVVTTVASLASADGWMASFQRQASGQMSAHWSSTTLLWALIGGLTTIYFWRKIWPPNDRAPSTRREIVIGSVVLAVPSLWWLTFPLRFLSGKDFSDVTCGLIAAAIVLGFGAWMVIRLIKAFESGEPMDPPREPMASPRPTGTEPRDPKQP